MTFKVIDTKTGKEPTRRVIQNIKNKVVERTMNIDQFFVGEDGALALLDEYGRIISVDMKRFEVVAESEEKMSDYILELEYAVRVLKKHCETQDKCEDCIFHSEKLPYCCLMNTPESLDIDKIFNKGE